MYEETYVGQRTCMQGWDDDMHYTVVGLFSKVLPIHKDLEYFTGFPVQYTRYPV